MSDTGGMRTSGQSPGHDALEHSVAPRELTRRELFQMIAPRGVLPSRGRLVLDRTRCSACALCVQECPTGALTADGTGSVSFVFREDLCDSCGLCVQVCPELCLTLERGSGKREPVVLFEDEFARCARCGVVIGSRAMISKVRSKLGKLGASAGRELSLCPACKGREPRLSQREADRVPRRMSAVEGRNDA